MSPTALGLFIILIVLLQNLNVSAKDEYRTFLVEFKNDKKTECIGFIISKGKIASTYECGNKYSQAALGPPVLPIIPYCNGHEVKIQGRPVLHMKEDLAFFTVQDTTSNMKFMSVVMNGLLNNHPLQYFGFEWVKAGVADKTVTLDVSVRGLDACNIHEKGTVIHQCASMVEEKMCLISGNGNLLDGAKFAGLFVKQASYCSKEIVFVPGETIMRLKPKP